MANNIKVCQIYSQVMGHNRQNVVPHCGKLKITLVNFLKVPLESFQKVYKINKKNTQKFSKIVFFYVFMLTLLLFCVRKLCGYIIRTCDFSKYLQKYNLNLCIDQKNTYILLKFIMYIQLTHILISFRCNKRRNQKLPDLFTLPNIPDNALLHSMAD